MALGVKEFAETKLLLKRAETKKITSVENCMARDGLVMLKGEFEDWKLSKEVNLKVSLCPSELASSHLYMPRGSPQPSIKM